MKNQRISISLLDALNSNKLKETYNTIQTLGPYDFESISIDFIKKNVLLNLSINNNLNFNQFELLLNCINVSITNKIINKLETIDYNKIFRFYQFEYLDIFELFKNTNITNLNYKILKDLNNLIPDQTTFIYKLLKITKKDIYRNNKFMLGTFNSISEKSALIYLNMVGCEDILENCKIFTLKYL